MGLRPHAVRVLFQQFDADVAGCHDESDPDAWADLVRLRGEVDALGLQLGGCLVKVLHAQAEVVQPLVRVIRRWALCRGRTGR